MNLKNYYYYFQSALSPKLCDDIVAYGKQHQAEMAVTGGLGRNDNNDAYKSDGTMKKGAIKNLQKKRKSEIVWMNDHWIYKEIHPYIHQANRDADWNFDWDFSESCQFTKYGVGQHYGWHCDSWDKPYDKPDDPNSNGKIRKLSVTVSLSDPSEYEGGNLEFDFRNQVDWERDKKSKIKECTEIRPRGSIIVFPSFVWHRVNPVTKGTRYSLVIWNLGRPFR
jgi:PKHD-type hydroxylase